MSDLQAFAAHARRMSEGADPMQRLMPELASPDKLALWTRLADETDAYLARQPEPDLFGADA